MAGGWFSTARMSRQAGGLLLAMGILGAGFMPWRLPSSIFLPSLTQALSSDDGVIVHVDKRAYFTMLPMPAITFGHVTLHQDGFGQLATATQLAARFRFLPLVGGSLQINDIVAYGVTADVTARAPDRWSEAFARRQDPGSRTAITVSGGRLKTGSGDNDLIDFSGTFDRDHKSGMASVWGQGIWRGQRISLQASGLPTIDTGARNNRARIAIQTPFASLYAQGAMNGGGSGGQLQLAVLDATGLGRWLEIPVPLAGMLEQFTLTGRGTASMRGVQLGEAAFSFGPNILKGTASLAYQPGERPLITATMATETIELNAISSAFDSLQDSSGNWSSDPFDTRSLLNADLDIRISATRARLRKMVLSDAALSATLKNGKLDLTLGRSSAYGGTLRGRASIYRLGEAQTEQKIQANYDNFDIGRFSDDLFAVRVVSGSATGQFQFEATGDSPMAIMQSLNGRAGAVVHDGELTGVSLPETLRRAERDQAQRAAMQAGSSRFDSATMQVNVHQGIGTIAEGQVDSVLARAKIAGQILFPTREYRINGAVLHPLRPKQWPFEIAGPWTTPSAPPIPQRSTQQPGISPANAATPDSRS